MKMKIYTLFLNIQLLYHISSFSVDDAIDNSIIKNLVEINNEENDQDFYSFVVQFFLNNTNLEDEKMYEEFLDCLFSFYKKAVFLQQYIQVLGYSGKTLSDLGLEEECLRNNFTYYLLTYNFTNGSYLPFKEQRNAALFFQQKYFYTGLCLSMECDNFANFLFNKTRNDKLYNYFNDNFHIEDMRVYDISGNEIKNSSYEPYVMLDGNGLYDEKLIKTEKIKYYLFSIIFYSFIVFLVIQLIISVIIHFGYRLFIKVREIRNDIKDDNSSTVEEDDETNTIFNKIHKKKEEDENVDEKKTFSCVEFLFTHFSIFDNIKRLLKRKNQYYNNIEIVTILRVICMIFITFINNFAILIKIPSKDFFYEPFYQKSTFFILKFASFSVDVWVCLDGFETMYKLIHYYKKYVYLKNKTSMTFGQIIKFYFYSFYKIMAFLFFFFITNYLNKYFIYLTTAKKHGALFEYYSNHIYKYEKTLKDTAIYLVPGYLFYDSYFSKASTDRDDDPPVSKLNLLIINEFYAFTFFIFIFYISNKLKSKKFDYSILIITVILYLFNYLICQFKDTELYYSYNLVLNNFLTVIYPHITFNYFFLGAMAGLTCFYYKDSFLNNTFVNDQENLPFSFCFSIIKLCDYLVQKGKLLWLLIIFLLQILLCFSFTFFARYYQSIYIPFNPLQKFVTCYEAGIFIILFCLFAIILFFIRNDNENKPKNSSNLFILIERTNFSFFCFIRIILYSYIFIFNFQLKLSYQNLLYITFGLFVLACVENLLLTLGFVLFFKMINKDIINTCLSSRRSPLKPTSLAEIMVKSRASEETEDII